MLIQVFFDIYQLSGSQNYLRTQSKRPRTGAREGGAGRFARQTRGEQDKGKRAERKGHGASKASLGSNRFAVCTAANPDSDTKNEPQALT